MAQEIDKPFYSFESSVPAVKVGPKLILNRPADNPFFTGREELLDQIHNRLTQKRPTAITQRQAINGLGGIGKTQLAIKYTYRFEDDYQQIFWVNAESKETIFQEYVKIANALQLPERTYQNQQRIVDAVMQWFVASSGWLLVLDNADEPAIVQKYIPVSMDGHVLLTTRAYALDSLAEAVQIDFMTLKEGVQFLLRRAKVISVDGTIQPTGKKDQEDAEQIVKELGALPLALDQAGAYIEEAGGVSLASYLKIYQDLGVKLLQERRGIKPEHPESVVKTFLLAFDKVEKNNVTAVNILRLCAFLAPEDIPESLITGYLPHLIVVTDTSQQAPQGHSIFGPWSSGKQKSQPTPGQNMDTLNRAFMELVKLSLIRRTTRGISVHRLVQAVLKEDMLHSVQHKWARNTVSILNAAFPNPADESTWFDCENLLTHALSCIQLIKTYQLYRPEDSQVLNKVGLYLTERARYNEAEPMLEKALKLRQDEGDKSPLYAESLHNLAFLYERQDKYLEAEQHLRHALHIRERELGRDHTDTAKSLNNLAQLYRKRNKLADAEPLYMRALEINRNKLGLHHTDTLQSLKNLATLYVEQNKYENAEALYQQALDYSREKSGAKLITAGIMHEFAELYKRQSKLVEADKLYVEAYLIRKEMLQEHPDVATSLNSIAELRDLQGNSVEAERLYNEALTMREQKLGRENTDTANSFYSLAGFYKRQKKFVEAEQLYKSAHAIWEKKLELNNPRTLQVQEDLAQLYMEQHRDEDAEAVYKRGLNLRYQKLRADDPKITQNLQALYDFYAARPNMDEKLELLLEQAFDVFSKKLSIYHSVTQKAFADLMKCYQSRDKEDNIEQLLKQVFKLRSQALRGDRSDTIHGFEQILQELTQLYDAQKNLAAKRQLYELAVPTCYEKLGYSDRLSKKCFHNLMDLYASQGDGKGYERAKQLYNQEFKQRTQALKKDDPTSIKNYIDSQHSFADFYEQQKQFEDAEQLLEQTLEAAYNTLGVDDPRTIQELHNLVQLYESHKKAAEGIRLYKQDVEICKHMDELGAEHPRMIESYNNLAHYYLKLRQHEQAEPIVEKMRRLCEPKLRENYVPFNREPLSEEYILAAVHSLLNAAKLYQEQYRDKRWQERADRLLQKALKISIEKLDEEAQNVVRESYIAFLMKAKRFEEAAVLRINATMMK